MAPCLFLLVGWDTQNEMKLTNATWLRTAPGAVAFTESGRRADQDERWSTAERDLWLVDEAPALSESTHWSSRVTTKLGCKQTTVLP